MSWDQAFDKIADHLTSVLHSHGHHSILHAFDYGSGTILKNLNQRFFYQLGGCTETVGSLCWDAGIAAQRYDFGQAKSHHPEDLMNPRTIVVWGRNVSVTTIHMIPFIRRAADAGAQVVAINPVSSDFSDGAALHIAPRPGTDGALALGVPRICRDNGWLSERFIAEHSVGWEELSPLLNEFSLDFVTAETDVPAHQIMDLARRYGNEGPVATLLGPGMQRYPGGGNAIRAIDALAAATGHVGVRGGGVQYAEREVSDWIDQEAIQGRRDADVREFTRGDQAAQILAATPPIKMLFVTRTHPITQVPNSLRLREAYTSIPVKVGVDLFLTETAEMMDSVLPCTHVLEDEDFRLLDDVASVHHIYSSSFGHPRERQARVVDIRAISQQARVWGTYEPTHSYLDEPRALSQRAAWSDARSPYARRNHTLASAKNPLQERRFQDAIKAL